MHLLKKGGLCSCNLLYVSVRAQAMERGRKRRRKTAKCVVGGGRVARLPYAVPNAPTTVSQLRAPVFLYFPSAHLPVGHSSFHFLFGSMSGIVKVVIG